MWGESNKAECMEHILSLKNRNFLKNAFILVYWIDEMEGREQQKEFG